MARRRTTLPSLFALAAVLVLVAFPACRASRDAGGPDGRRLRVAVIPMGTTHEFWKSIHAGALSAARELGVDLVWKGPLKEDDRNEQMEIYETLAASGVDAILLTPIDDRAMLRPVAEARRAGVPTVIFNTALQGGEHIAYVSTDNRQGGVLAAREVGRLTGGRGRLILVRVIEGVEGTNQREEGFLATLRAEFPGIEVVSENQYAGPSTEKAYQTMENLLSRFGSVDAVFTPNESTTFGCLRALQDHRLAGKIVHIGFDSSAKLIEALENGDLQGLVLQDPFAMGSESLRAAVAYLRGQPYEKTVATAVVLATSRNMREPGIARLLRPDLSVLGGGR